jgi:hypothetical protein
MADGWEIAAPRADALIESLRAFGYTPEAAVADLVDNSISSGATRIQVDFVWAGRGSVVRVLDNGRGMSEQQLLGAMVLGSTSPLQEREPSDLGRFGLGLKTASFSQARELTVVSAPSGSSQRPSIRRWDLDTVATTREWRLLLDSSAPIDEPPAAGGTVVQWSKCDRLVGDVDANDMKAQRRFLEITTRVERHLAATFHRFLSGRGKIVIEVNGHPVRPWDPFMEDNTFTLREPMETLPLRGELVTVRAFVLPHRSKLNDDGARAGGGIQGWNQQQGFYLYRSGRLLVQGDWLGLGLAKDEHTKLARIAIDFPASLDHEWQVDVKKASARPPGPLVEDLRRIARAARRKAEEVYRFRGKITARGASKEFVLAWLQYIDRSGDTRYRVNRNHPVIMALLEASGNDRQVVEKALRFIEETIPTTMIGVSIADSLDRQPTPFGDTKREIRPLIDFVFRDLVEDGATVEEALDRLAAVEPFSQYPEVLAAYRETVQ